MDPHLRPDELEGRLRERLDALGPAPRAELLHVLDAPRRAPSAGYRLPLDDGENMGIVRTGLSVSLDGFIAGPNDSPEAPMGVGGEKLLAWYAAGDTEYRLLGTDMVFMVSAGTAEYLAETRRTTGALVFGRRTFDLTHGWQTPLGRTGLCCHQTVPQDRVYEGSPFTARLTM